MSGRSTTVDIDPHEIERQLAATAEARRRSIDELRETGRMFHDRGWSLGTSSNYSVVLERKPLELLITASGKDKGRLAPSDFVRIDSAGCRIDHPGDEFPTSNRPSAEAMLHVVLAQLPDVGAVLHTHSVWGTLLSEQYFADGGLVIEDFEMLKGLEGINTHQTKEWVRIFDNTQDIPALANELRAELNDPDRPIAHGFLIRKHGLYTWGRDLATARRHIEIFEFLFECIGRAVFGK